MGPHQQGGATSSGWGHISRVGPHQQGSQKLHINFTTHARYNRKLVKGSEVWKSDKGDGHSCSELFNGGQRYVEQPARRQLQQCMAHTGMGYSQQEETTASKKTHSAMCGGHRYVKQPARRHIQQCVVDTDM